MLIYYQYTSINIFVYTLFDANALAGDLTKGGYTMKKQWGLILAVLVAMMAMVMGGCGGGGESGGVVSSTVSGVAAAGAPLVGTVKLKDSSSPAKELPGTINIDGSFSFNVDGLKPPFILKAQGTASGTNYTLYSFSSGPGTANINPLANLAVANAAGGADLAALYTTPSAATMQLIATNLAKAVTDIQTKLQPMLTLYNATANPISDSYVANHLGLDGVLDVIKVDISATGTVTLTNKLTNAVIYTGSISNFTSGTLATANIPQPPVVVTVTPPATGAFPIGIWYGPNGVSFTVKQSVSNGRYSGTVSWPGLPGNGTVDIQGNELLNSISSPMSGLLNVVVNITDTSGVYLVGLVLTASSDQKTLTGTMALLSTKSGYTTPLNIDNAIFTNTQPTTSVSVAVSPASASVPAKGSQAFTATSTRSGITLQDQATWSVVEANGGSITSNGVYTAPATAGTYHVKATSGADSTKSATATVTVTPGLAGSWKGISRFDFSWIGGQSVTTTFASDGTFILAYKDDCITLINPPQAYAYGSYNYALSNPEYNVFSLSMTVNKYTFCGYSFDYDKVDRDFKITNAGNSLEWWHTDGGDHSFFTRN